MPFIPNSADDRQEMLNQIGVESFDKIISTIVPNEVLFKGQLNVEPALSEFEIIKKLSSYAAMNISADKAVCFMGGGAYDRFIPSIVPTIVDRPEFRTAYTPYQAEVSQGTLQVMYEFQSMISELTKMDVSNASLYDAATSLAEACLLANAHTGKTKVLVAGTVNGNYMEVVNTVTSGRKMTFEYFAKADGTADIQKLENAIDDEVAAVIVQHPNFFGTLEDVHAIEKATRKSKALFISVIEPVSLSVIEAPGDYNADIAVGEGQPLGISLSYGGPYLGIFTCKKEYIRRLPGRIAGMTKDLNGDRAFVLTLQTREQQIKREKATSNICTNQGLFMLAATVYMEVMGREGLKDVASLSIQAAHYLADKISELNGYTLLSQNPFLFEFTVKTPIDANILFDRAVEAGFLPGVVCTLPDGSSGLTIAVTEKRTKDEIDAFVNFLSTIS